MTGDGPFNVEAFAARFVVGLRFFASLEGDMGTFLETVETAHALGPILLPTEYRDMLHRKGNADDLAAAVQLALPLVAKFREIEELARDRGVTL